MRNLTASICLTLAGLLLSPTEGWSADLQEVLDAAVRLKKAHVERSWEDCSLRGGTEDQCKKLLSMIHSREMKVWLRFSSAYSDSEVNIDQFVSELTACYSPNNTYTHLVDCWERLADRYDAAKNGSFLLKR